MGRRRVEQGAIRQEKCSVNVNRSNPICRNRCPGSQNKRSTRTGRSFRQALLPVYGRHCWRMYRHSDAADDCRVPCCQLPGSPQPGRSDNDILSKSTLSQDIIMYCPYRSAVPGRPTAGAWPLARICPSPATRHASGPLGGATRYYSERPRNTAGWSNASLLGREG